MNKDEIEEKIQKATPMENAHFLLDYIQRHMTDVKFDGPDMLMAVDNGDKMFLLSGVYLKKEEENGSEES